MPTAKHEFIICYAFNSKDFDILFKKSVHMILKFIDVIISIFPLLS
jgi:hypothetical protein